ncbi:MAG TPA: hypothetical protein ENF83_01820 [Candidatus Korarchaeota archaeon]|nr:hypothetical protein [Candidatus Korarchaeota archaeon]
MILITTSRDPSQRTRTFIRDLSHVIPRAVRVNRGKKSLDDLRVEALRHGLSRVLVVTERKGNPGGLRFYEASVATIRPAAAHVVLEGVTLRRELYGKKPERVPRVLDLAVAYQESEEHSEYASALASGLGVETVAAANAERDLPDSDVVLWIRRLDSRPAASFYLTGARGSREVGPRLFLRAVIRPG